MDYRLIHSKVTRMWTYRCGQDSTSFPWFFPENCRWLRGGGGGGRLQPVTLVYAHALLYRWIGRAVTNYWKVNFVASFGINTKAADAVYELNVLVCSRFNQICQLFSINIASWSVFILVNLILFTWFFALAVLNAFILLASQVFLILNTYYILWLQFSLF